METKTDTMANSTADDILAGDIVENKTETDKEYKTMKEKIMAQPKVDIFVIPTQLYPKGSKLPISLNGVTFEVPVGIKFKDGVPDCILKVYEESYEADQEILSKIEKKLNGEIRIL